MLSIFSHISENIREKYNRATKSLVAQSPSSLDLRRKSQLVKLLVPKPAPVHTFVPYGTIVVKGGNLSIFCFVSLCDPACAMFRTESYEISLIQSVKKNGDIHRQLSIGVGKSHLAKLTESEAGSRSSLRQFNHQAATTSKIFDLPISTLLMYSIEKGKSFFAIPS